MAQRLPPTPPGYVLVSSYLLTLFLTILTFVMFQRSLTELHSADRWAQTSSAFQMAEAAVDTGIRKVETGQFTNVSNTALGSGSFWAEVAPASGTLRYRITGHGAGGSTTRTVEAIVQLSPVSVFQFAIFGDQHVDLNGNPFIDSYNSSVASYDPSQPGNKGDVGTNVVTPGGIVLSGSVAINGQVAAGQGAQDPTTVVFQNGDAAVITGTPPITSQSIAIGMPTVTVPAGLTCTDLTLHAKQSVVLPAGSYCFQNITMNGGSSLTSDGSVTVYVTGDMDLGGHGQSGGDVVIGNPSDATKMLVLMAPTGGNAQQVSINGSAQFSGGLYGPSATVNLSGNAQVFGSLIARQIIVSGDAQVHYDEALGALTDPIAYYRARLVSWREPE